MRHQLSSILATVLLPAAAAAQVGAAVTADRCAAEPTTRCVLDLAESAVENVDGDRQRIGATLELAIALSAVGSSQAAIDKLNDVAEALGAIGATAESVEARLDLANGYAAASAEDSATAMLAAAEARLADVEDAHKRADLAAKIAVMSVEAGRVAMGLATAKRLPDSDDTFAAYKARALHDIAPALAVQGEFGEALSAIESITMGITYYQSVVRSDVGYLALVDGRVDQADQLFAEAKAIGLAQDNGYFVAGALRQLADAQARAGRTNPANENFEAAVVGARSAPSAQERARALSRIVTSMADNGIREEAGMLIRSAIEIADTEENPALRAWAHYEIAGAAAFAGLFDTAIEVLSSIPADLEFAGVSLTSATQRDIAWGFARHKQPARAIDFAASISTDRERAQALARIGRAMADPSMRALPRYL